MTSANPSINDADLGSDGSRSKSDFRAILNGRSIRCSSSRYISKGRKIDCEPRSVDEPPPVAASTMRSWSAAPGRLPRAPGERRSKGALYRYRHSADTWLLSPKREEDNWS